MAIVSVRPETPIREIAALLSSKNISAVPVLDDSGVPIGMVSEGDLIGRRNSDSHARRDWWLDLLVEGETLSPDFIASLQPGTAANAMSAPVVTVDETTEIGEIARLLDGYRIKRVPDLRDGHIVGIVSRADLVRALAAFPEHRHGPPSRPYGLIAAIEALDQRFHASPAPPRSPTIAPATPNSSERACPRISGRISGRFRPVSLLGPVAVPRFQHDGTMGFSRYTFFVSPLVLGITFDPVF